MARGNFLRHLRIFLMFTLLVAVALGTYLARARTTDWDAALWVSVYPINGDGSDASAKYITRITPDTFAPVEEFVREQAGRYGVEMEEAVRVQVAPELAVGPPQPPAGANALQAISWSLRVRYWSWQQERVQDLPTPDVNVYVLYFDPAQNERLAHSVGLQKGLLGVVNAFAGNRHRGSNNVVIAHELLHTLGATDKYDLGSGLPLHPDGYAHPDRDPLHPQTHAEIMGGRVPLAKDVAEVPANLGSTLVGPRTASEIGWVR